ncbi:hypothetical protein BG006_001310 [Podila minutissima]|uniref:SAP domain-containing protein n=1 Tax=Podila minutissima TaxID=64525 RepID=A0A9P5SAH0_9FUNG|nr:hypothetical protein BG006_001310 [Podila minutissima]
MSTHLSRRRKQELRDIAKNLGLPDDGTREDIYDRIKEFVAAHPNDIALREILGEDAGSEVGGSAASSANASRRSSFNTTTATHNTRSSPTNKTVTETRATRSSGESGRNSSEATRGLKEHQVHGFMNHIQNELHDAKGLAKQLQETLHGKFSSGSSKTGSSSSARRGSQSQHPLDHGSSSTGRRSFIDHDDGHQEASSSSLRHRRRRSYEHADGGDGENGGLLVKTCEWGQRWVGEFKHRFVECTGSCDFATCATKPWKLLHDDDWFHCLSFFTNWPDFLHPFFSYYGTLFVIPTLLSQLFNVDRSRLSRSHESSSEHHHNTPRTGLLSGRKFTTSGLSYFVFKFALTYFLGQSQGLGSLMGHLAGGGLWSGCKYISQVFRYVPQSLGLATSGVGTILALAEIVVSSARRR